MAILLTQVRSLSGLVVGGGQIFFPRLCTHNKSYREKTKENENEVDYFQILIHYFLVHFILVNPRSAERKPSAVIQRLLIIPEMELVVTFQ